MRRELLKRLRKLESRRPPQETEDERRRVSLYLFLVHAIAYYLGEPEATEEALITAYARALGYEHAELLRVLKEIDSGYEDLDYNERHGLATRHLCIKFDINFEEAENEGDIEVFKPIYAGLPESNLKERWRALFPNSQQTFRHNPRKSRVFTRDCSPQG